MHDINIIETCTLYETTTPTPPFRGGCGCVSLCVSLSQANQRVLAGLLVVPVTEALFFVQLHTIQRAF